MAGLALVIVGAHKAWSRDFYGVTYERATREPLNRTLIFNNSQEKVTIADSAGRFRLTANEGDSLRFQYIGLKDRVVVISEDTPEELNVGMDSLPPIIEASLTTGAEGLPHKQLTARGVQRRVVIDTIHNMIRRILDDKRSGVEYQYFNGEWIAGGDIRIVNKDPISELQIGIDNYGNKVMFLNVVPGEVENMKKKIEYAWSDRFGPHFEPIAEFPRDVYGGNMIRWSKANLRIPEGFTGKERVVVKFKVQPDGTITDAQIARGSQNEELNREALRLVSTLPKFRTIYFTPARPPIHFTWPVIFEKN